jgi:hypothetical protein
MVDEANYGPGTHEIVQINIENPAEVASDVLMASAAMTKEWGNTQSVILSLAGWASGLRGRREKEPELNHSELSLRTLWESPSFSGDCRPKSPQSVHDGTKQFPRQDMIPIIESLTGYDIGSNIKLGLPEAVDAQIIDQLRKLSNDQVASGESIDDQQNKQQWWEVPTFIPGVRMRLVANSGFKYKATSVYAGFFDIVLVFDNQTLAKVQPFSHEYGAKLAERFNWYKGKKEEKTEAQSGAATERNYNPMTDVPDNKRANFGYALGILGINDLNFKDRDDFLSQVKKKYRELAMKNRAAYSTPDNPKRSASEEEMKDVNVNYQFVTGIFNVK